MLNDRIKTVLKPGMTAEASAKAVHEVLRTYCAETGLNPDREVFIRDPNTAGFPQDNAWVVSWESGPYEWAIGASFVCCNALNKIVEPYYSFDLCFYPSEQG